MSSTLDPGTNPEARTVTNPPDDPPDPAERRRQGLRKSAADMLRSLAVIVGIVVVIVLGVPRPTSVAHPTADVAAAAKGAAVTLGWEPAIPQDLPAGWSATSAYVDDSGSGTLTWHIGYLTADGHYASIEQAAKVTDRWEEILTSGGTLRDPRTIDGTTWQQRFKDVRDVHALIHHGESRTTMVTSKGGGLQNAEVLARSILVQLR